MKPTHRRLQPSRHRPYHLAAAGARIAPVAVVLATAVTLGACGSGPPSPPVAMSTTPFAPASMVAGSTVQHSAAMITTTGTFTHPSSAPQPITVPDTASGTTVSLQVGQTLHVVLGALTRTGSTYWQFATTTTPVVRPIGAARIAPGPRAGRCAITGSGCGTVTLTVVATARGTTNISASRTTCGEAIRCEPAQANFRLVVHVV
jgi:hypothetical protein